MSVKPVKIVTDLQVNKEIKKVDSNNNVIFNVSGSLTNGHVSSSVPLTASNIFVVNDVIISGSAYLYGTSSLSNITSSGLLINSLYNLRTLFEAIDYRLANVESGGVTQTEYNNIREIITGSFDADGNKTIELQKFLDTDIDYISLNIFTQPSGTSIYTNDILSIEMSGNLNNKISISLCAPSYNIEDKYKIIAIKESI